MQAVEEEAGLLVGLALFLNGLFPGCMKLEPKTWPVDTDASIFSHLCVTHTDKCTHNHTRMWLHACNQENTLSTFSPKGRSNTHANPQYFGRPVTFTQLNELSNLTIPQPLHYRGISILQHVILPVHSSPTPLMQAPGQAGRNWIADGILMQQMQWSRCVCEGVWWSPTLYGSCFFILELIRAANNSLLRFHFSNKPLEAVAWSDSEQPRGVVGRKTRQWSIVRHMVLIFNYKLVQRCSLPIHLFFFLVNAIIWH